RPTSSRASLQSRPTSRCRITAASSRFSQRCPAGACCALASAARADAGTSSLWIRRWDIRSMLEGWRVTSDCQGTFFWEVTYYLSCMHVDCQCQAFQVAVEILGRPWNAFLLTMLQDGALRFSEIAAKPNGPGDKVLAARLKDLEARGLIARNVDAGPPVKVSYALTKHGRSFGDVSAALQKWGRGLTT